MGELSDIAKELNLPKQILEKGEQAIKAVLGPSIKEISETFADNFRLRRFKNQTKILIKANEHIKKLGFDPKKIDLKVLAPLVQLSSLEENQDLQQRWAKLITNIVRVDGQTLLKQNSIEIISKISNEEAQLIDFLHKLSFEKRDQRFKHYNQLSIEIDDVKKMKIERFPLKSISFSLREISERKIIKSTELELMISNLNTLGVTKWKTEVNVLTAEKLYPDPDDSELEIDLDVYDDDKIMLTSLGLEFIKMCTLEEG